MKKRMVSWNREDPTDKGTMNLEQTSNVIIAVNKETKTIKMLKNRHGQFDDLVRILTGYYEINYPTSSPKQTDILVIEHEF